MEATEATGAPRPRRANELGPTGSEVARRLKVLREGRRLTTEDLAKRLTERGRPMRATAITKIERSQRRVDADDLMALAIALNVSPLALLLPVDQPPQASIMLTENTDATRGAAWRWGRGDEALPPEPGDAAGPEQSADYELLSLPAEERYGRRQTAGRIAEELRAEIYRLLPAADITSVHMPEVEESYNRYLSAARASLAQLAAELDRVEAKHGDLVREHQARQAERTGGTVGQRHEETER